MNDMDRLRISLEFPTQTWCPKEVLDLVIKHELHKRDRTQRGLYPLTGTREQLKAFLADLLDVNISFVVFRD